MTRNAPAALAAVLLLTGCPMSQEAVRDKQAAREAARARADSVARQDSAQAALQARVDSLRGAVAETRAEIDEGFRETDSLRIELERLGGEAESARQRIDNR